MSKCQMVSLRRCADQSTSKSRNTPRLRDSRMLVFEPLELRQMLDASSVLISEIMYNPAITARERASGWKGSDFEYVELRNAGSQSAALEGTSFDDAVSFAFGRVTLAPGQYAVVVRNPHAFEIRYGSGPLVLGQYDGTLGDGGDHILFQDVVGRTIQEVTFDDMWYATTDGDGFSLTIRQPNVGSNYEDRPSSWRPSTRLHGSPGYGDGPGDPRPQELTIEVLSSRHVALQWGPPAQLGPGLQDYRVYRDGTLLASVRDTSFTDATAAPEGNYSYQVSIVDITGTEYLSSPSRVTIETVGGDLTYDEGARIGPVRISQLDELSGLAAGRENPNVLWTHNDGPQTSLHAIGTDGNYLGAFTLAVGSQSHDWEDIAIGPGPETGVHYIYVGDIGGKKPKRNEIRIYRLPEPVVSVDDSPGTRPISDVTTITLRYPDGIEFNSETLLSDPRTGDLYVIPKRGSETPVYRAAAADLTASSAVEVQLVGHLVFPNVSAGDISPTGDEIIIRNEDFAQLFPRGEDESVAEALSGTPIDVRVIGRPTEPNGEAITFDSAGQGYFTISEGTDPPLFFFQRKPTAQPGDSNRDQQFDQVDLVMALSEGKYLSNEPATWSQGDWNGDGFFDARDIVSALQTGSWLRG